MSEGVYRVGQQRAPAPTCGSQGRGAGPPGAHALGRGPCDSGLLGWGSAEHSVPSVTTHVESVCKVSGGLIYSVFTWPSRLDAFRSWILLGVIS